MTIKNSQLKWFFYTVILGIFPVFWKSLVYLLLQNKQGKENLWLDTADIVFFGVALALSRIGEIERSQNSENWKSSMNFLSIFLAILGSLVYALALLQQNIAGLFELILLNSIAYIIAFASFLTSLSIFIKIKTV